MQSLTWYWRRLRSMSPGELGWRLHAQARDHVDRCLLPWRSAPTRSNGHADNGHRAATWRTGLLGALWPAPGDRRYQELLSEAQRSALLDRAERALRNELRLFGHGYVDLGPEVQWNYEYVAQVEAPLDFAPAVDYRDYRVSGDAKIAWEPSRHQHLPLLGRAYRVTGEPRFAEKAVEQIETWIAQCPYGRGLQWRSPLELAIRVINWVVACSLIEPAGLLTAARRAQWQPVIERHVWEIARRYSRYSSANNHRIGEAAGVLIACAYFGDDRRAARRLRQSWRILQAEIERQTHPDGGNVEQAFGYHLFVMEFFQLAAWVAQRLGETVPAGYVERLQRMAHFAAALREGGQPPLYGDHDEGYVLDLDDHTDYTSDLLARQTALWPAHPPSIQNTRRYESAFWLTGEQPAAVAGDAEPASLHSEAFPDTGLYLLQAGAAASPDRLSVTLDAGPLGYGVLAAHGHADALAVTLRIGGHDVLVDPGTYDYFTHPEWRTYFRGTPAHNTVTIDDANQSEMLGPFLWGRRAAAKCMEWSPTADGGNCRATHDGYLQLPDPVHHEREITVIGAAGEIKWRDVLSATSAHEAALYLHFAEDCDLQPAEGKNRYLVSWPGGQLHLQLAEQLEVAVYRGSQIPRLGWISRGYHDLAPAPTLVGRCRWSGELVLETSLQLRRRQV